MLPKSETKALFKTFIHNTQQGTVADLSRRYTPLCLRLLGWYLRHLACSDSTFKAPTNTIETTEYSSPPIPTTIQYEPLPFTYAEDASLFQNEEGFPFIEGFGANPTSALGTVLETTF